MISGPPICPHLGPPTGEKIDCYLCGGGKQIPLHSCDLHGVCTTDHMLIHRLSGLVPTRVQWCQTCPDGPIFQERERIRVERELQKTTNYLMGNPEPEVVYVDLDQNRIERPLMGSIGTTVTYSGCTLCCGTNISGITCCPSGVQIAQTLYLHFDSFIPLGPCSGNSFGWTSPVTLVWNGLTWTSNTPSCPDLSGQFSEIILICSFGTLWQLRDAGGTHLGQNFHAFCLSGPTWTGTSFDATGNCTNCSGSIMSGINISPSP